MQPPSRRAEGGAVKKLLVQDIIPQQGGATRHSDGHSGISYEVANWTGKPLLIEIWVIDDDHSPDAGEKGG